MESLMGNMARTQIREVVFTKQQRIAHIARQYPKEPILSLNHYMDVEWLMEAYHRVRKGGATGVDGQSSQEYAENLEENLTSLLSRAKQGTYRAPPVKRVEIPKGSGKEETRPIGIPTFEDKILQRGVQMLLEPVFENSFYNFSFGFRPKRSAHQALEYLRNSIMGMHTTCILDLDIRKYFDTIEKRTLKDIVKLRVRDGVVTRLISKWLEAGIQQEDEVWYSERGTPQGGVISPLLSNIYLHVVLDWWYVNKTKPRLRGKSFLVRFADDAVMGFEYEEDANKVMTAVRDRLASYGLELHPKKTKLIPFERPPKSGRRDRTNTGTFDFLGFTHYWGRSKKGNWVVFRKTAQDRFARATKAISEWCQRNRHKPIHEQATTIGLKLRGHYAYYGITGNFRSLGSFFHAVHKIWHKWLDRRGNKRRLTWARFQAMLDSGLRLPEPRIVHSYYS